MLKIAAATAKLIVLVPSEVSAEVATHGRHTANTKVKEQATMQAPIK
jgi:hypothetical protein